VERGDEALRTNPADADRTPAASPTGPTGHTHRHDSHIQGSKADDTLDGTDAGERLDGLAGRDQIVARGGDDVLDGGTGNDVLMGGLSNDTYVFQHHGAGADLVVEEGGTDTLQGPRGRAPLAAIEILRHGNDLLIRWSHDRPEDIVLIRSWFADAKYRVERLVLPDGTVAELEPLAARAKQATSEDVIHFSQPSQASKDAAPPDPTN
jgi:hypothetical protein